MNKKINQNCRHPEHFSQNKLLPVCRAGPEMHRPATLHVLQSVRNKIDTEAIAALRRGIFRAAERNG